MKQGKLIVLEGIDGSGKGTQVELLNARLHEEGYRVETIDFPRYHDSLMGKLIGRMLAGELGDLSRVSPYLSLLPFALDRWQAKQEIVSWLTEGTIVLANRYIPSNLAHQAANLERPAERKRLQHFIAELEYGLFGMPREDLVIYLDVPVKLAFTLIGKKTQRQYLGGKRRRDAYERDRTHLTRAAREYRELMQSSPRWQRIACVGKGRLLSETAIHEQVWRIVKERILAREKAALAVAPATSS
ncbi:MAG: thymidylate kinase [Parcubacteria group bacterium]|nr:thymidylate kinase [Parcubacteria group bacterium]